MVTMTDVINELLGIYLAFMGYIIIGTLIATVDAMRSNSEDLAWEVQVFWPVFVLGFLLFGMIDLVEQAGLSLLRKYNKRKGK